MQCGTMVTDSRIARKHVQCKVQAAEQKDMPDGADDDHPEVDMGLGDGPREVGGSVVPGNGLVDAFKALPITLLRSTSFKAGRSQPQRKKPCLMPARHRC